MTDQQLLEKERKITGYLTDSTCHYRNLAIILGATPDQMLGDFDRQLCQGGLDPDETSGGYHVSINEQLEELKDVWDERDRLEQQNAALTKELADLRAVAERLTTDKELLAQKVGSLCLELEGWRRPTGVMYPTEQPSVSLWETAVRERDAALHRLERYHTWMETNLRVLACEHQDGCPVAKRPQPCMVCGAHRFLDLMKAGG